MRPRPGRPTLRAMPVDVWTVTAAAAATALATGLGALPFAVLRNGMRREWLGVSNAVAAGFMLAASVGLVWQGAGLGPWRVVAGGAAGWTCIVLFRRLIGERGGIEVGRLAGADALKAVVIVAVMTAHSASEGVGVGVSYGGGEHLGVLITLAIAVHNIPEGLAISLVLVPRGLRVRSAAAWSVFSSLPQPLLALPAYLFVEKFKPVLPAGLGFAAGAMVWLVVSELIPDAREGASNRAVAGALGLSFAAMMALQALLLNF
jgi:zinc transporter, ZIP family